MKFKQQAVYALLTAVEAGLITLGTQAMGGWPHPSLMADGNALTYLTFAVWACYFAIGGTLKAGLNWLWSMFGGGIGGILMFFFTFLFMGMGMSYLPAVTIGVIIVVWFMMFPEKVKMNGAGMFVGTALFFALHSSTQPGGYIDGSFVPYLMTLITEMIYAAFGVAAGWVTISFIGLTAKLGE